MSYFGPGVTPEECRNSCSQNTSCTAYLIPTELWPKSKDWCERFTSVGATGDGRTSFECFTKTSTLQGAGTFISQSPKSFKKEFLHYDIQEKKSFLLFQLSAQP